MIYKLKKDNCEDWIRSLRSRIRVAAPRVGHQESGEADKEQLFPRPGTLESIKSILLPPEEILAFGRDAGEKKQEGPTMVWGVKPCDMKGVELLDEIFRSPVADNMYIERRESLVFAGFVCREMAPTCFCNYLGIDRASVSGFDLVVVEDGEYLFIRPATSRGEEIIKMEARFLETGKDTDERRVDALLEEIEKSAGKWELKTISEKLEGLWDSEIWTRISDTCLGCGVCSFVCPQCWCFDVRDVERGVLEQIKGAGAALSSRSENDRQSVRIRCWDSCQLGHYARVAGGADPYKDPAARVRHRFFHKLKYIPDTYGKPGCTGCGRCVLACPSGLDVREIISELAGEMNR